MAIAFDSNSIVPLWLDGTQRVTKTTFDVVSPVHHQVLWKASAADEDDVRDAIASAASAFKTWRWKKPQERRDIFLRAYQLLKDRRDESHTYSSTETGVPPEPFGFEYGTAIDMCLQLAGLSANYGTLVDPDEKDTSAAFISQPYGVVLGIAPWNAPHTLGMRACLFPLAAGNTVILKGPELAPATYWHFVSILHEAGLPAGCLNTIYHRPSDAAAITRQLISHPTIRKVNFTGSTAVGSIVAGLCGQYLKPCLLELGGKNAAIVCADADLELAAQQCALGAFNHAGQVCMSTERIIVNASVVGNFRTALKAALNRLFGPDKAAPILINEKSTVKVQALLDDAVKKGASVLHGSLFYADDGGNRLRPVVLEDVKPGMRIYHEESFGPSVSLYTVADDEQALQLANDTPYGLTAAVFTEDLRRGLKFAKRLETGAVHINNMTIHDEVSLPHGGVGDSGFGRFNGSDGLREWVRTKAITWRD
ncbi:Aldehyde/histidinol dehydrogenase [Talaromyces proteolyticus]|uniref:Aldehyde/histidinol dehydrogenase n=1 Tax=Talaromyces proteolyticus TaxID=1131652 RepID=A0AAD4KGX7_9EURO|nr:Aldehyde/histidinol dehydrogenase [Talaromyces proteolyticus]KAH8691511.1 Aldehyde/histidinol dehydrogenase [Talaromyces proteolyticus]